MNLKNYIYVLLLSSCGSFNSTSNSNLNEEPRSFEDLKMSLQEKGIEVSIKARILDSTYAKQVLNAFFKNEQTLIDRLGRLRDKHMRRAGATARYGKYGSVLSPKLVVFFDDIREYPSVSRIFFQSSFYRPARFEDIIIINFNVRDPHDNSVPFQVLWSQIDLADVLASTQEIPFTADYIASFDDRKIHIKRGVAKTLGEAAKIGNYFRDINLSALFEAVGTNNIRLTDNIDTGWGEFTVRNGDTTSLEAVYKKP